MTRALLRLLAAALLGVAAGGGVVVAAPAQAAACNAGQGVTVVVDSAVGCDANGGGRASSNFTGAGHTLRYAARQPGFVCRVDGAPASDPCVNASPADAYWGLFWSDGTSGKWAYSTLGVSSLKVPAGGWVALVFQSSNSRTWPSVTPITAKPVTPSAKPTAKPTTAPPSKKTSKPAAGSTSKPSPSAGATAVAPGATGSTPSTGSTPTTGPTATTAPTSATPSVTTTEGGVTAAAAATTASTASEESTSSPWGVALVGFVVVALLAGAGGIAWRRRRGM